MAVKLHTRLQRGLGSKPRTLKTRQLDSEVRHQAEPLFDWALEHGRWNGPPPERPRTRGECANGPRPCPWVSCRHHLFLDVKEGRYVRLNFPGKELEDLAETCALDVADKGKHTLEQVGDLVNLTRRPVLRIEQRAARQLKPLLDDDASEPRESEDAWDYTHEDGRR
jgi:hypothetical protein